MRPIPLLLIALLLLTLPHPSRGQSPDLDGFIRDYAKERNFSGTVLVQAKGKKIYHKSFGEANRVFHVRLKNDTKFKIASITKSFTAVLILQLAEQGRIDLHRPFRAYLPSYTGEAADKVTVHHLLNHTSGLPNIDTFRSKEEAVRKGIEYYQRPLTTDEMVTRYCSGKLVNEPGKVFDYNNADYILLGKIIEALYGKPYEQVLKERILKPLQMENSGLLYQYNIVENLADTYFRRDDLKTLVPDLPVYIENWYASGAMYSTAPDLLKFSNALFSAQLIKPETLALMLKPGLDEYGYSVWVRNEEVGKKRYATVQRYGQIMGANVVLYHFRDPELTLILLSNTEGVNVGEFAYEIGKRVLGGG